MARLQNGSHFVWYSTNVTKGLHLEQSK